MSHQIDVTTLLDGPRHTILHVTITSDGVSDDIENYVIADPADFEQWPNDNDKFFTLETVQSALNGFSASLKFDYMTSGNLVQALPEFRGEYSYITIGGLRDRSPELDGTGKILLSTVGLDGKDVGSFVLKLRK